MGRINNYISGQFSEVILNDGSKVLVSMAPLDVKVLQLGWFGIPKRELHTFDLASLDQIIAQHGPDVLKFLTIMVQALPDPNAVSEMCRSLELISSMKSDTINE